DVARPRTQMRVTRVDLAPGVDDADDRPARPIVGVVAELAQPRAVSERAQIVDAEPAMAAQIFRTLASHGGDPDTGVIRAVCAGFILSRALGWLPSPLWGGVWGGGRCEARGSRHNNDPPPARLRCASAGGPPPHGEGKDRVRRSR